MLSPAERHCTLGHDLKYTKPTSLCTDLTNCDSESRTSRDKLLLTTWYSCLPVQVSVKEVKTTFQMQSKYGMIKEMIFILVLNMSEFSEQYYHLGITPFL